MNFLCMCYCLPRRALARQQLHLYARDNLALVQIFIKDPFVTKLKRDEAFSIILFVAGAGGTLSRRLEQ